MRIGKILRFGRTRSNLSLDIVNLFNSNDNLAYRTLFNADLAGADGRCCCRGSSASTSASTGS